MATREQVMVALYTRLTSLVDGLSFTARAYVDPNTLQPEQQPALLLLADQYLNSTERGRPQIRTINAVVVIYVRAAAVDDTPETLLNTFIDRVEMAMERQPNEAITDMTNPTATNLGGLCSRVSIMDIDIIPGDLGGQGAAMMNVEILIP